MADHRITITVPLKDMNWTVLGIVDAFARPKVIAGDIAIEVKKGNTGLEGRDLKHLQDVLQEDPEYVTMSYRWDDVSISANLFYSGPDVRVSGTNPEQVGAFASELRGLLADHLREDPSRETESEVADDGSKRHIIERALTLPAVVIRAEDLRALADEVEQALRGLGQGLGGTCEIEGSDGSTYKSDLGLLRDLSPVRGRVQEITIYAFQGHSKIYMNLEHGKSAGRLRLASGNREWLGATQLALLDLFEGLEPQRTFPRWQRILIGILAYGAFIVLGVALNARLSDAGSHLINVTGHKKTVYESWVTPITILISVLASALGMAAVVTLGWWITKLFPTTELQVGKPHTRREAQRRHALGWVASVIIIPAVIAIVIGFM